jgi:hypothetical protein
MLATISDEMSVSMLVNPSAQTVVLTAGRRRPRPAGAAEAGVCGQVAQAEQFL